MIPKPHSLASLSAEAFLEETGRFFDELVAKSGYELAQEPSVGESVHLPIRFLVRGQDEVSVHNVIAKLNERIVDGDVVWSEAEASWQLAHDEGQSSVSIDDPIFVVKGSRGYVVTDGHHDVLLALYVGARTIPAQVIDDLSQLEAAAFWREMKRRRLVDLSASPEHLAKQPPKMSELVDNPNRYFASLVALKVGVEATTSGASRISRVKGPANAIWIKTPMSPPFIEFRIARALSTAGVQYDPKWSSKIPSDVVERARAALSREVAMAPSEADVKRVIVIDDERLAGVLRVDRAKLAKLLFDE